MKLSDVRMASRFVLSGGMSRIGLYPPPFGSSTHAADDCDKDDALMRSLPAPPAAPRVLGAWQASGRTGAILLTR